MATWSQQDLESLCGVATVLACLDDDNDALVDQAPLALLQMLSDAKVAGRVAPMFPTKFPLATAPPLLVHASLLFGKAMMFERRPEYVKVYGDGPQKAADKFLNELMERPDFLEQSLQDVIPEKPVTDTGGAVFASGSRMILDNVDGSSNTGDF